MNNLNQCILIVEDEPVDADLLQRAVRRVGVKNPIRWVTNGEEALRYLLGQHEFQDRVAYPVPRVIITDIKMPQMSGLELLKWVYENPKFRVVPIVVMTSSHRQSDVDEAFRLGANAFFP